MLRVFKVVVTTIERLDQGHLYPLGERRDKHVTGGARTSALLHRRQGSPSACVYMDSTGCRPNSPCKALGFIPFQGPSLHTLQVRVFSNHVGVTTIERLDQGHLYPLGER